MANVVRDLLPPPFNFLPIDQLLGYSGKDGDRGDAGDKGDKGDQG